MQSLILRDRGSVSPPAILRASYASYVLLPMHVQQEIVTPMAIMTIVPPSRPCPDAASYFIR